MNLRGSGGSKIKPPRVPCSDLSSAWGRGDHTPDERGLGEGTGRGDWERGLGEGTGRGDWEKGLREETGSGDWERGLGEGTGRGDWERGLGREGAIWVEWSIGFGGNGKGEKERGGGGDLS